MKQFLKTTHKKSLVTLIMALQLAACNLQEASTSDTNNAANTSLTPTGAGSVTLNWVAPVAREDESPISMSEIAGYRVHYGTTRGIYPKRVEINDAYTDEVTLDGSILSSGTTYMVMTTVDTEGRESRYSAEITLNI